MQEPEADPRDSRSEGIQSRALASHIGRSTSSSRQIRTLCGALQAVTDDALRTAILDLGMEDAIPLWEVTDDCRRMALIDEGTAGVHTLAGALLDLARQNKIRVLVGWWDDPEPRHVGIGDAETLLADFRRYSSAEEIANDLQRVYYVNVDNILE